MLVQLQSRLLCARYLSLVPVPVFPDYAGDIQSNTAAAAATAAAANASKVEQRTGVSMVLRQPLLLASCHPGALNVFALLAHAMRVVS